jgi:SAM-dependent methyltransferase
MIGHERQQIANIRVADVKAFWEANPLCARAIPHAFGTVEYFAYYDALREENEPVPFASSLHEYDRFAGKRVLDVGSGNGYVLSRYAMAGADAYGADLTSTGIGLCRRRFELAGLRGHFTVANAESLPFPSGAFDCVCSMGVLHHTPDTEGAVREIHRVLRPGGRLIVMFYHRNSFQYRLLFPFRRLLAGKSMRQSVNEVDGVGNPKGDVYSRAELRALLDGFANLEISAGVLPWHRLGAAGRALPRALRAWADRRAGWFLYAKGIRV